MNIRLRQPCNVSVWGSWLSPCHHSKDKIEVENAGTQSWSDSASTIMHSFVGMRLHDGRMPPAERESSYDKKGEVYRLFRRSTHTHAPHTPHTHTSHTHHRQTNHIHITYTHTISHKHHTRPSLSTHFLQLNSLNSSYSGFSCHAGADLSLAYSPTGNLKGFKYFLEGEPVWRLRRLVGFVDCGREVRADSFRAARAQGNRTLAELHHVSQGVNSWFSDDYWQQRGVGHANLGWNPGMFFGWFPVSSLKVGECWAAASTTGSRWRRRLRALCQQHVCGWLHPATIDMFSLAYTYQAFSCSASLGFHRNEIRHQLGIVEVQWPCGGSRCVCFGRTWPASIRSRGLALLCAGGSSRRPKLFVRNPLGSRNEALHLRTSNATSDRSAELRDGVRLQCCRSPWTHQGTQWCANGRGGGAPCWLQWVGLQLLQQELPNLRYGIIGKASSRALSKDIFWGSRFRTWFESLQLAWATRSSQQQQA